MPIDMLYFPVRTFVYHKRGEKDEKNHFHVIDTGFSADSLRQ